MVVHCQRSSFDVYIGRPSKWGNPFDRDNRRYQEKIRAAQLKIQQARDAYARTRDDPETIDRLLKVTPGAYVTYTVTESAGVPNSEQEIEESEQKSNDSVDVKNTENPKPVQGSGPGRFDLLKKNASLGPL